jgi:ABC-type dipeptide/oligopeptide/nickel transport system ATPase component
MKGVPVVAAQNVEMILEGENTLVIRVDLTQEFGESGSGKSVIIASTGGATPVPGREQLKANVTIYRPVKAGK